MKSRVIHNIVVPRNLRGDSAVFPPAQSGDEDTDAETLCQNSDVAIICSANLKARTLGRKGGQPTYDRTMQANESSMRQSVNSGTLMESFMKTGWAVNSPFDPLFKANLVS